MNDIDLLLDKIRCNCSVLSRYHQKRYLSLKSRLKFYRIPILVLSALNSVTAVGLSPYLQQNYVSLLNMSMSLIVGIIGSVEMYYGINTQMEIESNGSRDFYILSTDIYKYLSLKEEHKTELSVEFLNTSYNRYIKLVETSLVLKKKVEDKLSIIEFETNQINLQIKAPYIEPQGIEFLEKENGAARKKESMKVGLREDLNEEIPQKKHLSIESAGYLDGTTQQSSTPAHTPFNTSLSINTNTSELSISSDE